MTNHAIENLSKSDLDKDTPLVLGRGLSQWSKQEDMYLDPQYSFKNMAIVI